jgi:hypothetical protein
MLNAFDLSVYSEEVYPVTEQEHDEVMQMITAESENFVITSQVGITHKPKPRSIGRINGVEL